MAVYCHPQNRRTLMAAAWGQWLIETHANSAGQLAHVIHWRNLPTLSYTVVVVNQPDLTQRHLMAADTLDAARAAAMAYVRGG